ncbi:MAG: hypothetical protein J5732_02935 [Bacteroidaceae bacterium]|nr:hypothetical protein [Bacteroidaceae bacterium]
MNKAPTFNEFWDAYGLKRNKLKAEPAWNRLTAQEKRAAIAGIPAYRAACQQQGIAMMYPQNYLRDHRWQDETEEASSTNAQVSASATQGKHIAPRELQYPDLWHQPSQEKETAKGLAHEINNFPSVLDDMETW